MNIMLRPGLILTERMVNSIHAIQAISARVDQLYRRSAMLDIPLWTQQRSLVKNVLLASNVSMPQPKKTVLPVNTVMKLHKLHVKRALKAIIAQVET